MSAYPEGLYASDFCYMEGCVYPDSESPDPMARGHTGEPRSKCVRCGLVNYGLRAYLAAETRRLRQSERSENVKGDAPTPKAHITTSPLGPVLAVGKDWPEEPTAPPSREKQYGTWGTPPPRPAPAEPPVEGK